jgi:hypothetical protein
MANDRFAKIAAAHIEKDEKGLITPKPPLNESEELILTTYLPEHDYFPMHKMTTAEELTGELEKLREIYHPYMRSYSPAPKIHRKRQCLDTFDWRLETPEDKGNLQAVMSGGGAWECVTIPHYGGPIGVAAAYYRTEFILEEDFFQTGNLFICFMGADYKAHVFVNGCYAGSHEGFFAPFEFDITKMAKRGVNSLLVRLENDNIQMGCDEFYVEKILTGDKIYAATGPGWDDPEMGWHHCPPGMGLYQQVYLEVRNQLHIQDIFVRTLNTEGDAEAWVDVYFTENDAVDIEFGLSVYGKNFEHTEFEELRFTPQVEKQGRMQSLKAEKGYNRFIIPFKIENPKLWSPQTPWLYDISIDLYSGGVQNDSMCGHFGVRTFEQQTENEPKGMFYLNGKPIRLRGANTMGFEQQEVMQGNFDRLRDDILLAKLCNMNFLRLTQRPVQSEIYDYCDMLGIMIQTDLPMFGTVRINQFCEVIRQAGEMERLIRSHPCCVVSSYINEPMPECNGMPHRQVDRATMMRLFEAADSVTHLYNPDRVIKHVDGDYDPPACSMPDNHCYTLWYSGHGIDIGRLIRGYWQKVLGGWYYGCGEFGAEGLDSEAVMHKYYPANWMPQSDDEEKTWTPSRILGAQTGRMHRNFFDTPHNLTDWVGRSQEHQSLATKLMTEAFRRDRRMVSFAIHLFIDAFPSGWMKTIMDCERNPKKAYFAYRDALSPVLASLRSDRLTCFAYEKVKVEAWVCNDTCERIKAIMKCVVECNGEKLFSREEQVETGECTSEIVANLVFNSPSVDKRKSMIVRMGLLDENGIIMHDTSLAIEVFPPIDTNGIKACPIGNTANRVLEKLKINQSPLQSTQTFLISDLEDYYANSDFIEQKVRREGAVAIFMSLPPGEHILLGERITVKKSCSPHHFLSRNTGHELVKGYREFDFRFWYDQEKDMITPIADTTLRCDFMRPILLCGGDDRWEYAAAEMICDKGRVIVCQAILDSHIKNPVAADFICRMLRYKDLY